MNTYFGVPWRHVVTFYALACSVSWPIFWLRDMTDLLKTLPVPAGVWTTAAMWGPGIAAGILMRWRGATQKRPITLLGPAPWHALAFYISPCAFMLLLGARAGSFSSPALAGTLLLMGLVNVLGEEIGWRGYLQAALRPLPFLGRHLLIATLWEAWHFTGRLSEPTPLWQSWAVNVLLSMVMGVATERSRAILVAVTLHAWFNLAFELPIWQTYGTLGVGLIVGSWALWRWPQAPRCGARCTMKRQAALKPPSAA